MAGFTFMIGLGVVAIMGMIGDVIDEIELLTGLRQEGLFFSARAFFAKASYSFGHFFAGIMLDVYVHMPFNAVPGQLEADVLTRIGVTAGPLMGIAAIISLLVYGRLLTASGTPSTDLKKPGATVLETAAAQAK